MILILAVGVLAIAFLWPRGRFWRRLRGAPSVQDTKQANRVTSQRIERLLAAGQAGNAVAVQFGSLQVPLEVLSKPTILFGLSGAGKTVLIQRLVRSLLPLFKFQVGRTRFVFLDVKNELPRLLHAIVPGHIPIHLLNALDTRASLLDFPQIFSTRSDIEQLAHTLCPPTPGDQNPFFRDGARQIVSLTASVLQKYYPSGTRAWGLFELCSIIADRRTLRTVMNFDFEARSFYSATLGPKIKSSGDMFSTLRSVVQPLISAAHAEQSNASRIDLKEFLRQDALAVLGVPSTGSQAVLPIFNIFLRRLVEEAQLAQHPDDRLFLVLDEIALLDRAVVESIVKATCIGRSHGIHVIAATQGLELLEARFGQDQAHAFLSSCATVVGFRAGSKRTAEYIVGRMGEQEGLVRLKSHTSSRQGSSTTASEHLQKRPAVLVDELLHLPLADPIEDRLEFFAVSPAFGNVRVACPFVAEASVETDPSFPNYCPRNSGFNALRPPTESDLKALGFPLGGRTSL